RMVGRKTLNHNCRRRGCYALEFNSKWWQSSQAILKQGNVIVDINLFQSEPFITRNDGHHRHMNIGLRIVVMFWLYSFEFIQQKLNRLLYFLAWTNQQSKSMAPVRRGINECIMFIAASLHRG